ncbi:hypothetical protein JCM10213_002843 [Rhodosporidiobolus nylandii]
MAAIVRFCQAVQRRPSICSTMRELSCERPFGANSEDERMAAFSSAVLPAVFASLHSLLFPHRSCDALVIRGMDAVAVAAVTAMRDLNAMRQLRDITLVADFDWEQPLAPQHWAFLADLPRLDDLDLRILTEDSLSDNPLPPPPVNLRPISSVTTLNLVYAPDDDSPERPFHLAALGALFPNLEILSVYGGDGAMQGDYLPFFQALPSPDKLVVPEADGAECLPLVLPSFRNLSSLTVTRGPCPDSGPFYAALRQFSDLTYLKLDDDTCVSPTELLSLIEGPDEHPTLDHVDLSHLGGCWGASVRDYGPFWDKDEQRWTIHAGS